MRAFLLLISLIISGWSFEIKAQTTSCFSATYVANPTCPGLKTGNISLNITGGSGSYNIFFNGSTIATTQTTFSNLSAGAYAIRIIDAKNINCTQTISAIINNYLVPTVTINGNSSFCSGQNISLTANLDKFYSNSYSYTWSNGNKGSTINIVPTSAGSYSVSVTDAAGCIVTSSKSITQVSGPSVSFSGSYTNCSGKQVTLVPIINGGTGPYTYSWDGVISSTATKTVNPTSPQTYCLTVRDANNCSAQACVVVNQRFLNLPTGISKCQGENYTIVPTVSNFSGALSYQWSNGATSSTNPVTINATQSYAVTVSDATGCIGTASTSIGMNANPSVNLPATLDVCQFNAVTLDTKLSTTSNTFAWSTGSTASAITLTPSSSTNISVIVTNANNCKAAAAVSINVRSNPSVSLPTSQITCTNTPFTLTPAVSGGTPGYAYLWSNGSTNATLTTSLSVSGAISLRVTDQNGCAATAISGITLIPNPTISISGIFEICPGQSTTLTALPSGGTLPYSYKWNTGDTSK